MTISRTSIASLALSGTALALAPAAQASLIGDEITANLLLNGSPAVSVTETVLDGPEATGNWAGFLSYDVQGDTITITSLQQSPTQFWAVGLDFEFLGLDWVNDPNGEITGVSVINATGAGFSDIDDSDLSFTAHSVFIDAVDIENVAGAFDQSVTIQIQTNDVPTPGALALIGAAGLTSCRRRRRA